MVVGGGGGFYWAWLWCRKTSDKQLTPLGDPAQIPDTPNRASHHTLYHHQTIRQVRPSIEFLALLLLISWSLTGCPDWTGRRLIYFWPIYCCSSIKPSSPIASSKYLINFREAQVPVDLWGPACCRGPLFFYQSHSRQVVHTNPLICGPAKVPWWCPAILI